MNIKKFFRNKSKFIFPCIILLLVLIRIPSLFEPRWYGDEGIYAAVANEMSHGEKLYVDAWDHKPPAIYVLYWFADLFGGGNLFVAKILNLAAAIGTLILVKKLAKKFFNEKISLIVSAIFAFLVGTIIFEGNIANAENFFMFFTTLGMYLYLNAKSSKLKVLAGLSFSTAVLFKIHPLFDFVVLAFFMIVVAFKNKQKIKNIMFDLIYVGAPFILLQLWTFIITGFSIGSFSDYIFTNITYNLGYTSYTESVKSPSVFSFSSLTFRAGVTTLIFLVSGFLYLKKKISDKLLLLVLWLTAGLFAAFLSARAYPHYALQVLPAFVLLVGLIVYEIEKSKRIIVKILLVLAPLVLLVGAFFGFFPEVKSVKDISKAGVAFSYYSNFVKKLSGSISDREYNDTLDKKVNATDDLVSFIKSSAATADRGKSDERVSAFLWGNHAWFYDVVNADNPSRYVVDFHMGSELGRKSELMYDLEEKRPVFIVQEKGAELFGQDGSNLRKLQRSLKDFVTEEYNLVGIDIGERYMVYKLAD